MVEILINILVVDQTSGRRLDGQKWKLVVDRLLFICEADSDNLTMTALATFVMYIVTIMERSVSDRTMVSFKTIDDRREWEAKCLVCVGDFIIMGIRCEGEDDQDAWSEIEELWILCFDGKTERKNIGGRIIHTFHFMNNAIFFDHFL